jgi:FG-GAP-like repeat
MKYTYPIMLVMFAGSISIAQTCNFDPPASYGLVTQFGTGSSPTYIASGDLDGDGDIDLITDSNSSGEDPTHVLWNDGAGNFTLGPTLTSGWGFGEVALGDMDGDGDLDVLRANYFSNGVMYYTNNGDGTFTSAIFYAGGGGCIAVDFVDFDNDGDLDFVTVDKFGSQIRPYRNINGLGFTSVGLFDCGISPIGMDTGDVDNDDDMDVVVTNEETNTFTVLYNDGAGNYPTRQAFVVGERPTEIILEDLNGDSILDAVVTDWDGLVGLGNTVSVRLGDGAGGFGDRQTYTTALTPRSVRAGDMDGDGNVDLVVACEVGDVFSLLFGSGDGTFNDAETLDTGIRPNALVLEDLDMDGDLDIAYASNITDSMVTVANDCGTPVDPPSLVEQWQVGFDNFFNIDNGTHVVVNDQGEIIVAGTTSFNFNEEDFMVVKFDANGDVLWETEYNGDGDHFDQPKFLGLDDNGNIFVAGQSWGPNFSIQWAVLKIDTAGNILWTRRFDGGNPSAQQNPLGFAIGPNGEFAMTGWARDASFTTVFFAVVCYDADGVELWNVSLPQDASGINAQGNALAFDPFGNVVATGTVPDDDEFGKEMLTAKISPAGTVLWTHQLDLSPDTLINETIGHAITTDAAGNIFVAGGASISGFSNSDAVMVMYAPDGTLIDSIFDARPGSVSPMNFLWIAPDSLLMTGIAGSGQLFATSFDPAGSINWSQIIEGSAFSVNPAGHVTLGSDGFLYFIDADAGDVTVEQRDLDGTMISRTRFDTGSTSDVPNAITAGSSGALFVVGMYEPEIVSRRDVLLYKLTTSTNPCIADLTGDGVLNFFDISAFLNTTPDIDGDGDFDFFDVSVFLNAFTAGCP